METTETMLAKSETHEDTDWYLASKIEAQHLEEHEKWMRDRKAQEEVDAELARKLAEEGDGQGTGTSEGGEIGVEGAPTEGIVEESLMIERDAQLALQLQNGRSLSEVKLMQEMYGVDPGGLLSQADVTEKFRKGIMAKIMRASKADPVNNGKRHISSDMDYFGSSLYGHGWDCGYKNLQMMFSCLLDDKEISAHLKKHGIAEVPTVPELQGRIEEAWRMGFDPEGMEELGGVLLDETKWIGPSEVAALLRSLRLRANIVNFSATREDPAKARLSLLKWVQDYYTARCQGPKKMAFRSGTKCTGCSGKKSKLIPPLFLQNPGHSRTIVGADVFPNGDTEIMVLDPNISFAKSLAKIGLAKLLVGKDSSLIDANSFQIVYIDKQPIYPKGPEWENSRSCVSESA